MKRSQDIREKLFRRARRSTLALMGGVALSLSASSSILSSSALEQSPSNNSESSVALAQISIGTNPQEAIAPTFMGLAHEWGDAQALMGDSGSGTNAFYRNLLGNLMAYGSGPIVIRIGGNSTDTSTAPTANTVRPFAEVATATGAHFYLGVNLGAANLQLAVEQTRAFLGGMPPHSVDAIEIGNEPDSYVDKGMRPPPYSFLTYLAEFDTWRKQIYPLLPAGTRLLGPSWAYPASLKDAGAFLDAEHSYLYALSQHYYVGNACQGHTNPADTLLKPRNTTDAPARMQRAVAMAHAQHVAFRVDELNSIACGGEDGISNTFGSALWAIDIMFEFARAGVDGVNWQSPNGAAYSFLNFDIGHPGMQRRYAVKAITPLYYGMLFFQAATGNQARLLPVSVHSDANIKAWATLDARGSLRLAVVNKGGSAGVVDIVQPGYRSASVLRLTAPSLGARTGVRFAGQTMDGSVDGKLKGVLQAETILPAAETFQIPTGGASAFLVEFHR